MSIQSLQVLLLSQLSSLVRYLEQLNRQDIDRAYLTKGRRWRSRECLCSFHMSLQN